MIAVEPGTETRTDVDLSERVADLKARLADLIEGVAAIAENLIDRTEPA